MKLKKLVRRLKQILDAVDTIQQRVNYINESSDELDKLISLVVASNKGYDIEELSKLIGNPVQVEDGNHAMLNGFMVMVGFV